MTVNASNVPSVPPVRRANTRRMLLVWALLLVSMTVVALAGLAALPEFLSESTRKVEDDHDGRQNEVLGNLIWPNSIAIEQPWTYIVIHHSATSGATLESIAREHTERLHADGTAYHFLINTGRSPGTVDGQITLTPRWVRQQPGVHCNPPHHPEFSRRGIGICVVGNFNEATPTPKQMDSLVALVSLLSRQYNIPLDRIVSHNEIQATDCPGRRFPTAMLLGRLRQASLRKQLEVPPPEPSP